MRRKRKEEEVGINVGTEGRWRDKKGESRKSARRGRRRSVKRKKKL